MKRYLLWALPLLLLFCNSVVWGQPRRVAMTVDDVPFEGKASVTFESEARANEMLLSKIRAAATPITAFFTGHGLVDNELFEKKLAIERGFILFEWLNEPLVTIGNHSEHHLDNSKTDLTTFMEEVNKVDRRMNQLASSKKKPLIYFRFPYNALGKDSADQAAKREYLASKNYIITPFTIESADYAYNAVYVHELALGHTKTADSIEQCYLDYTMKCFKEAEDLCQEIYGRSIDHIFLFHDVPLNAHCYDKLLALLKAKDYSFISLDEALKDSVYHQTNYYYGRFGISWLYRWMKDPGKRREYLKRASDPDIGIYREYERLQKESK